MKLHGLIIDPQQDFCDPDIGALYVPGAENDMARLAALVRHIGPQVEQFHVTLDSHHLVDIAHPAWWKSGESGIHPDPFTIITLADLDAGTWTTADPEAQVRSRAYVAALEAGGKYPLCVWPPHCLIGSAGQTVAPVLFSALTDWERETGRSVDYVVKGLNPYTEHYSAIQADVPDASDPNTQTNTALVENLRRADGVFVAGEAGSHCVANTVRDLANAWKDDALLPKLVLLTDAIAPVAGFAETQAAFVRDMTLRGMQTATTTTFLT